MRALLFCCLVLLLGGCEQKMTQMPRIDPLAASDIFSNGSGARVPPAGTVSTDAAVIPGRTALPAALDLGLMQRGRERFNIFCSPCHDYTGHGHGRVVQRGFPQPPDFHSARLIAAPDGHFFDTITHGHGAMFSYASRVPPDDRWAIIAYIRALQYSEQVPAGDLTPELRQKLAEAKP
jgi:mono/diheme cytochrome c family protein